MDRAWWRAVSAHPACYLRHRAAVFAEQMGVRPGEVFFTAAAGVDPNPFGLALIHHDWSLNAAGSLL